MSNYRINGTEVSEREFKELEKLFKVTSFPVANIFKDGNVETAEIEKFLDFDKNGFVSGDDFRLLRVSYPDFIFGKLVSVLARHGFDVDKRITEHLSDGSAPPEATLKSRELMLATVEKDPAVLIYSPSLRRDRDFMIKCISKNKNAQDYIDVTLTDNPDFILDAVKINSGALFWASDNVRDDPDFISSALKVYDDYSWLSAIEHLVKVPETVLVVMKRRANDPDGSFNCSVPAGVIPRNNAELKADDITFLAKAALIDFHYLECVSDDLKPRVWPVMLSELKKRGMEFPLEMRKDFNTFKKVLKEKYNIERIDRFRSLAILHTVLRNRFQTDRDDKRPVALWVASKADHNGAFNKLPLAEILIGEGKFRVYYYEVETDEDSHRVKEEVLRNGRHLHTLVISGHGKQDAMRLGNPKERSFLGYMPFVGFFVNKAQADQDAQFMLDAEDIAKGKFGDLLSAVEPGGQVFLYSCSTGEGAAKGNNMTNAVTRQVRAGVSVLSPTEPVNLLKIKFEGLRMNIQYHFFTPVSPYNVTASR